MGRIFLFIIIAFNVFVVSIINSKILNTKVRNYVDEATTAIH